MEDGGEGDYGLGAEKGRSEIWEEGGKHYREQKLPWVDSDLIRGQRPQFSINCAWMLLAENGLGA